MGKHGRGEAAGEPGFITQEAEQFQADGLAGLFLGGMDIETGRGEEGGVAMGMDDPEGEDDTLFLGALQMASDEINDAGEHFGGGGF
jgi:hypothetical protein